MIKFTIEVEKNRQLLFLDVQVYIKWDNNLGLTIYWKQTPLFERIKSSYLKTKISKTIRSAPKNTKIREIRRRKAYSRNHLPQVKDRTSEIVKAHKKFVKVLHSANQKRESKKPESFTNLKVTEHCKEEKTD